jgi:NhaC family Na+:H+ antiporter
MAGVLQVPTLEYLPFAFFNLLNPLIAIIFGFTGFRVEHTEPDAEPSPEPADAPGDSGEAGPGAPDPAPGGDRS